MCTPRYTRVKVSGDATPPSGLGEVCLNRHGIKRLAICMSTDSVRRDAGKDGVAYGNQVERRAGRESGE